MTQVIDGDLVKVMSWYDNEWGYASQAENRVTFALVPGKIGQVALPSGFLRTFASDLVRAGITVLVAAAQVHFVEIEE